MSERFPRGHTCGEERCGSRSRGRLGEPSDRSGGLTLGRGKGKEGLGGEPFKLNVSSRPGGGQKEESPQAGCVQLCRAGLGGGARVESSLPSWGWGPFTLGCRGLEEGAGAGPESQPDAPLLRTPLSQPAPQPTLPVQPLSWVDETRAVSSCWRMPLTTCQIQSLPR